MSDPIADLDTFKAAFEKARLAFGLHHYHVTFEAASFSHYAEIEIDADECAAAVRVNLGKCAIEGSLESTAVHECLHLLMADFGQAGLSNPKSLRVEEERVVRRL